MVFLCQLKLVASVLSSRILIPGIPVLDLALPLVWKWFTTASTESCMCLMLMVCCFAVITKSLWNSALGRWWILMFLTSRLFMVSLVLETSLQDIFMATVYTAGGQRSGAVWKLSGCPGLPSPSLIVHTVSVDVNLNAVGDLGYGNIIIPKWYTYIYVYIHTHLVLFDPFKHVTPPPPTPLISPPCAQKHVGR